MQDRCSVFKKLFNLAYFNFPSNSRKQVEAFYFLSLTAGSSNQASEVVVAMIICIALLLHIDI